MIDTNKPDEIRLFADFLNRLADIREAPTVASVPEAPTVASVPEAPTVASVPEAPTVAPASVPEAPTVASVPELPMITSLRLDGELDVIQVPYNETIHSRSKSKTTSGEWRVRRKPSNVDADTWKKYVNDYYRHSRMQHMQPEPVTPPPISEPVAVLKPRTVPEAPTVAPAPVPEAPTVAPAPVPEAPTVAPVPEAPTVAPVPEAPTVASAPESEAPTVASAPESEAPTFGQLIKLVTDNLSIFPHTELRELVISKGVQDTQFLAQQTEYIPEIYNEVLAIIKERSQ